MTREIVVYEKVYRVSHETTGVSSDPDYHDADTPEEAGRYVTEYLRSTPTWKWVTVKMEERLRTESVS